VSERAGERERGGSGFGRRRPNASEAAPGRGRPASERQQRHLCTEVGERERESCVGGEMKISIPSNQFSNPKEKKRKNKNNKKPLST